MVVTSEAQHLNFHIGGDVVYEIIVLVFRPTLEALRRQKIRSWSCKGHDTKFLKISRPGLCDMSLVPRVGRPCEELQLWSSG